MNVLLVYAHPEPRSLNGALKDIAVSVLEDVGHVVQVTDLYASRWKSQIDRLDYPALDPDARLRPASASKVAFETDAQPADVVAEQAKLAWADAVILQFPLWWFAAPAILKGWIERVYAYGLAYGVGEHSETRWGDRYGEGSFVGKRAMLMVTAGGWEEHYTDRGINGSIDDLLFPINHGVLFYPGFDVLPPFVVYKADSLEPDRFIATAAGLGDRMRGLFTDAPIPYRRQNAGDYELPSLRLKAGLEAGGTRGFALHRRADEL